MTSASTILPYLVTDLSSPPPFVDRTYGEPLFHTESDVAALQFAADGTLWSVEESGVLRQWSPEGRLLARLFLSDLETLWTFNPTATLLASASDDLAVWEIQTGKVLGRVAGGSWITAIGFSADSGHIVTGHDDGVVRVWAARTLAKVREFKAHPTAVSALALRLNKPELVTAGEDRLLRIWDLETGKNIQSLSGHTDRVPALAWQPNGDCLISAGWDTTARVWAPPIPDPVILLNAHSDQVQVVAFSPDGRLLACADSDFAIHVWSDPRKGKSIHLLRGHSDEVHCLAFSSDGKRLASAGGDRIVHIWDTDNGQLVAGPNPQAHHRIALSESSGTSILFSCAGSTVESWDANSGAIMPALATPEPAISIACSPDGKLVATSGNSPQVHVWEVGSRKLVAVLPHTKAPISGLRFAADSRSLASASLSDGLVWLWRIGEPEAQLVIPNAAESSTLDAIAIHTNGKWLAVGGMDWLGTGGSEGCVCLWDLADRDKITTLEGGVASLDFDSSGRLLAGGAHKLSVLVWDVEKQSLLFLLTGHQDRVGAVAFSPDGSWLASGSDDSTLRIWNVLTGKLAIARQFDSAVQSLLFSRDGKYLYTGNGNSTCYRLEVKRLLED